MSLMSLTLASSGPDLDPDGVSSVQHEGAAPGVYSQKPPLAAPPSTTKAFPHKNQYMVTLTSSFYINLNREGFSNPTYFITINK